MANVTYLIGAGASAGKRYSNGTFIEGLPCVREIPKRLENLASIIRSTKIPKMPIHLDIDGHQLYTEKEWTDAQNQLLKDVEELQIKCADHATIDTYAKNYILLAI